MRRFLFSLGLILSLTGCQSPRPDQTRQHDIDRLRQLLCRRIPSLNAHECTAFARDAVTYALATDRRFERTTTPYIHNFLVNIGVKRKGLCWHYADALYRHLMQRYPKVHIHLVGASIGSYWREHNAVAVTGTDNNLSNAVILDAWRTPGRLISRPIEADRYVWHHRPEREVLPY